jgi:DNA topoisomerase-3
VIILRLVEGDFQKPRNGQKNDKAHPPIHPTAHAGNLAGDEKRVYEFVTRRFLACCSTNAEGLSTNVDIEVAGEGFSTSGLVILARNYLEVYPYDKWSDSHVPNFQQGERFMPSVCEMKDGQTASPAYLTEADLVGLMDKNGIGKCSLCIPEVCCLIDRIV